MNTRARSPLKFTPPRFNAQVMGLSYACLPLLLRVRLRPWLPAGIWPVECRNPQPLLEAWQQFQQGKIRLLLAFRHSQVDDPMCLAYMFSHLMPQAARAHGVALDRPIHSHFLYDRGMPLWAGRWLSGFFSRLGGVPVHRGRLDMTALKAARALLLTGEFPLTIAPEGATNGHGEAVSPLEPGTAQIAFWGVEGLRQANRPEEMILLPVGLQYFYSQPNWPQLNRLMDQMERDLGLAAMAAASESVADCCPRLQRIGEALLAQMEQFYRRFYHRSSKPAPTAELPQRLQQLLEISLAAGERFFALPSSGNIVTRCRRLEEAGWADIYREDIPERSALNPVERGLADWLAQEAQLHMAHMRLVESFVAVTGHYVSDSPSFERLGETALIMFDALERIKGTRVPRRPQLGRRRAVITIGEPINVSQRWSDYAPNRRAAKAAVTTLTADLQQAMEELIVESGRI